MEMWNLGRKNLLRVQICCILKGRSETWQLKFIDCFQTLKKKMAVRYNSRYKLLNPQMCFALMPYLKDRLLRTNSVACSKLRSILVQDHGRWQLFAVPSLGCRAGQGWWGSLWFYRCRGLYARCMRLLGTQPLSLLLKNKNTLWFQQLMCIITFIVIIRVIIVIPSGFMQHGLHRTLH